MKAIVYTEYGSPDVLQLQDVSKPNPKHDEVLIRVHAATATPPDCLMRSGASIASRILLGLIKPNKKYQTPGVEFAGEVEAIGEHVTRFKPGDQVYGFRGFGTGTCAEYKCMPEKASLSLKPVKLNYVEAAAIVDGATTAFFFLKEKANLRPGQKVLINGASGGIGVYAVQFAKYFGAYVTGVCSGANLDLVKSLGADKTIDYSKADFTQCGETYDIIFDVASKSSFSRCKNVLTPKGCYLFTNMKLGPLVQTVWTRMAGGKRVIFGMSIEKNESLAFIKELAEDGKLRPVIDRCYPLEKTAEAHRYVETGHKKGSVVITM
jgi:NADPH:quinone reductase-like Zn-dependent oxidoreductase